MAEEIKMIRNAQIYFFALFDLSAVAATTGGEGVDILTLSCGSFAGDAELAAYHLGRAWAQW